MSKEIEIEDIEMVQIDEALKAAFLVTVNECLKTDMLKEFCRLHNYSLPKSPMDIMIDQATGRMAKVAHEFFDFVRDYVFLPCLDDFAEPSF